MAETSPQPRGEAQLAALRFGVFELDVRSGELRRNGTVVRLQPQPFKVLVLLASRPGEVVTREEIQAEVWPAGTFVDFEQSLNFCVRQIRAALSDNANAPRFVETLPRRGYRWVGGAVERVTSGATVHEFPREFLPVAEADRDREQESGRPARWLLAGTSAVAVLATVAAAWLALKPASPAPPPSFQRITFRRGVVTAARFAPDGQVSFSAAWDGSAPGLYVSRSDPPDIRPLDIAGGEVAAVSSAGEVAFLHDRVLARAPLSGGPAKEVLKGVVAADWTADGSAFAVARYEKDRCCQIEFPVGHAVVEAPQAMALRLSPDQRYLAVTEHPTLGDDRGLVVVFDREGRVVAKTAEWASLEGLAWSPGSDEVWFSASEVGADNALRSLGLDGRVRMVLSGTGRLVLHDIDAKGRALIERTTSRMEMYFHREGQPEGRDLSWLDYSAVVGISRDGGTIFFYESGQGGGPDYTTFLRRTDGSLPVRVGSGRGLDLSPDGQWVLSVSLRHPDHVDLTPTGPGEARRLEVPGVVAHESGGFLPDGRSIFVGTRDAAGRRATWLVDLRSGASRRLPLPEGISLTGSTFSPDGSRFVARCPDEGRPCFYDTVTGKSEPVRGAEKGWWAVGFDEHGRIFFVPRKAADASLLRLDPRTGRSTVVDRLAPRDLAGVGGGVHAVVDARGDAWAYSVGRRLSDLYVVSNLR
jgi:DNA-binding winged helix-turn-helix (wHTH) protein/WD40 repeat protein